MSGREMWMSVSETAERLDVTYHKALEMVLNGELPGELRHDHYEIPREAVDQMLAIRDQGGDV
jgi:excisionase family DNA binding protein